MATKTITPLEPFDYEPALRLTYAAHGIQGSGKTRVIEDLIAGWGKERVCVISCGQGLSTVGKIRPKHIPLLRAEDMALAPERLAGRALDNLARCYEHLRLNYARYDWWVLDDYTAVADFVEEKYSQLADDGDSQYVTHAGNMDPRKVYRDIGRRLKQLLIRFRELPINGYVNTLTEWEEEIVEREVDGKKVQVRTGKRWLEPALAGKKIAARFPAAWDGILHFYTETVYDQVSKQNMTVYWCKCRGDDKLTAKIRSDTIPTKLPMGVMLDDGTKIFNPDKHWNIPLIWEHMTGVKAPLSYDGYRWDGKKRREQDEVSAAG